MRERLENNAVDAPMRWHGNAFSVTDHHQHHTLHHIEPHKAHRAAQSRQQSTTCNAASFEHDQGASGATRRAQDAQEHCKLGDQEGTTQSLASAGISKAPRKVRVMGMGCATILSLYYVPEIISKSCKVLLVKFAKSVWSLSSSSSCRCWFSYIERDERAQNHGQLAGFSGHFAGFAGGSENKPLGDLASIWGHFWPECRGENTARMSFLDHFRNPLILLDLVPLPHGVDTTLAKRAMSQTEQLKGSKDGVHRSNLGRGRRLLSNRGADGRVYRAGLAGCADPQGQQAIAQGTGRGAPDAGEIPERMLPSGRATGKAGRCDRAHAAREARQLPAWVTGRTQSTIMSACLSSTMGAGVGGMAIGQSAWVHGVGQGRGRAGGRGGASLNAPSPPVCPDRARVPCV